MAEEYPFLGLLALCFIMFAGSLAFAYIPYAFTLSPRKVRLMSVFGAGLLVGTALIVVVPEGVHMMWSAAQQASREHAHRAPQAGPPAPVSASHADHAPMPAASPIPTAPLHAQNSDGIIGSREGLTAVPRARQGAEEHGPEAHAHHVHADGPLEAGHSHDDHDGHAAHGPSEAHAHAHGHEDSFHSATIGLSLAAGFVFMLLVDRFGGGSHGHTHGGGGGGGGDADTHYAPDDDESKGPPAGSAASNTLIGLLIHSAVDGVAMGVSAVSGGASSAVSLIVFAAIMMHKGPAAFGLASFMLQDRLPRHLVRRRLLMFALSAPVGAVVTYFVLVYGGTDGSSIALAPWLLFSAGTFLYVATSHILPELQLHNPGGPGSPMEWAAVCALIAGVFAPAVLQVEHSH